MKQEYNISMIAAAAENNAIGKDNKLLWSIPEDMRWFRDQTRGKPVIMGRKTHESIGKLLPKRPNIIVTRNKDYKVDGAVVVHSLEDAFYACQEFPEIMVIGGEQIYQSALPAARKIFLTVVHDEYEGDAFFPEMGPEWKEVWSEFHEGNPAFTFKIFEKNV